jgi:hypothetical protein
MAMEVVLSERVNDMALSKNSLKTRIIEEMTNQGANPIGEHSWIERLAEALASAVIDEIQQHAQVRVSSGSSAGTYSIQ